MSVRPGSAPARMHEASMPVAAKLPAGVRSLNESDSAKDQNNASGSD
jgi:hypothetical protein